MNTPPRTGNLPPPSSRRTPLAERIKLTARARGLGTPTVPSSLELEKATNPFLRAGEPAVKAALGMDGASDVEVFAHIRAAKDKF
jgi:hydroxyacylglutathione hydrolase